MPFLNSVLARARARRKTIVLAEGEDARIIGAARRAQDDAICQCILLGNEQQIRHQAAALGVDLADIRIEDPSTSQYHER